MRTLIVIVALLLAAPLAAQDLGGMLDPDAALIAQEWGGGTLTAASWRVGEVYGHRVWADLLGPLETWGLGGSADLAPGRAACIGGGWQGGWLAYVGAHLEF